MTVTTVSRDADTLCRDILASLDAMGGGIAAANAPSSTPLQFAVPDASKDRDVENPRPVDDTMARGETDPLPSRFPVTALATASIGAAGAALSSLLSASRTPGSPLPVSIDTRLAALWFGVSISPIDWVLPGAWDAIAGDYRTADGWIRLHTNAPAHRRAALDVLQLPDTLPNATSPAAARNAVQERVAQWHAAALEEDVIAAGGCAAQMLTQAQWTAHPQGRAVAGESLIQWNDVAVDGGARGRWHGNSQATAPARPLAGLRVLDLTRILAGPVATRFLAGFGADVLRIDPPDWDEPSLAPDVTLGKHCARLNLQRAADRRTFETLLASADVLIHGYRPGALEALGYDASRHAALCPGLVDVSLSAYGHSGPWAMRRGFDSLVQMSSGIADAGMRWRNSDSPYPLPVQALDHATGYLIAAAALRGLALRQQHGHGGIATLSLARTAHLLTGASAPGAAAPYDPAVAKANARPSDFSRSLEKTQWGSARRLLPPLAIEGAPMHWSLPARPLGQDAAAWTTVKR
ncbi:CoA transferase [Robbsia sp. KACC 23696]|uniref:CoA transferase n=1 Tax=Robbsia sp. KACC 23696 TaxID=3149231 RepID=UPI00325C00F9